MTTQRGQNLVLFTGTMLLLTVMVMMTVSFGIAAARKTDLDNVADAAAYSQAVSTARTFNSAAVLNRAIVAHYVSMAGISAQMMYLSTATMYFGAAGEQFRQFDVRNDGQQPIWEVESDGSNARCPDRTWEIRDASYEMWHAGLSMFGPGAMPGDNSNWMCDHRAQQECMMPRGFSNPGIVQVEHAAIDQASRVHDAIFDLAQLEDSTFTRLKNQVNSGSQALHIADRAGLQNVSVVHVTGREPAIRELMAAGVPVRKLGDDFSYEDSASRPFADAILGSRPPEALVLPGVQENLPPLVDRLQRTANAAFRAYAARHNGGRDLFRVTFNPPDISVDFSIENWLAAVPEDPVIERNSDSPAEWDDLTPGMTYETARAVRGSVITQYFDRYGRNCSTNVGMRSINSTNANGGAPDPVSGTITPLAFEGFIRTHSNASAHTMFGDWGSSMHWVPSFYGGCHGNHAHYGSTDLHDHDLTRPVLPLEVLGFNLPSGTLPMQDEIHGARGVWGQPKLPVMLAQTFPSGAQHNPWNLAFRFTGRRSGSGERFDMKRNKEGMSVVSSSAGLAYYHRREHLGEPPNMLNPYWHASLVPMEIDERGTFGSPGIDITGQNVGHDLNEFLREGQTRGEYPTKAALGAYGSGGPGLRNAIRGLQTPVSPP